jgi:hypothetical protein
VLAGTIAADDEARLKSSFSRSRPHRQVHALGVDFESGQSITAPKIDAELACAIGQQPLRRGLQNEEELGAGRSALARRI